jgi:hypothetical protein
MTSLFKCSSFGNDSSKIRDVSPTNLLARENIAIPLTYFSVGVVGSLLATPLNVYLVNFLHAEPKVQNTIQILQTLPVSHLFTVQLKYIN